MLRYLNKSIIGALIYFILITLICIGLFCLPGAPGVQKDIYQTLAVSVIIAWIMLVVSYFIWALYFYNVNLGWTDEDWVNNAATKKITPEAVDAEPDKNPHEEQTMGLPPGTIRGTIALSMLVAGLAMTIASLSMNSTVPPDSVFIDNFEFFKTAFLMMIAFYFGTKSLEVLDRTRVFGPKEKTAPAPAAPAVVKETPAAPVSEHKAVLVEEDNTDADTPAGPDVDAEKPDFHDPNAKG